MKLKTLLLILLIGSQIECYSQNYNAKQLKTVAKIWGQCYLFHPSIIRADKNIEWEKQLVEFLPQIKKEMTRDEFIKTINSGLLSKLLDPFTKVQSFNKDNEIEYNNFMDNDAFDYIKITAKQLSDISSLQSVYESLINSKKPLVIDLRINSEIKDKLWDNSFFDYFTSMFIDNPIPLSLNVKREHFGWDEYNDWWYYEQKWKISNKDRQETNNGILKPFTEYSQELQQYIPDFNFDSFSPIIKPIYFLTNNSFNSYYNSLLIALKTNRPNTFVINDNSGKLFTSEYSNLISYKYDDFEFILNSAFYVNNGHADLIYDLNTTPINAQQIVNLINSKPKSVNKNNFSSFEILPRRYRETGKSLSTEEKILGVIKIWTIVKYFYPFSDRISVNWDNILDPYLTKAQKSKTDKDYYELVKNMMSKLNDSHVSTYHPSILDYSKLFVAPIQFSWIQNKVIITAVMPEFEGKYDVQPGDEILSIDNKSIQQIIQEQKQQISASNESSFYHTVINPGNFVGAADSSMKLTIKRDHNKFNLVLPRSVQIFQFFGFDDKRPAYEIKENNIGYLNLSALTNSHDLESRLRQMQNTDGLIIDLRNGYPTDDYAQFIEMLATKRVKGRIDETPIISATKNNSKVFCITKDEIQPDNSFTYNKPIAVLIDKSMVSRPEDIAIDLKAIGNTFFVGEQTQGTDGEMTKVSLPGGGETSFTGQKIYFANGDQFQGTGILPDYKVERTIEGVKKGKDEILEEALKIIRQKISKK